MIKIVDRYVGRSTLVGVLAVWFSLTLLMALFTLIDQLCNQFRTLNHPDLIIPTLLT